MVVKRCRISLICVPLVVGFCGLATGSGHLTLSGSTGKGMVLLLLGSVSTALMKHVSDPLAGRLSLVEVNPLTLTEPPDISITEYGHEAASPMAVI